MNLHQSQYHSRFDPIAFAADWLSNFSSANSCWRLKLVLSSWIVKVRVQYQSSAHHMYECIILISILFSNSSVDIVSCLVRFTINVSCQWLKLESDKRSSWSSFSFGFIFCYFLTSCRTVIAGSIKHWNLFFIAIPIQIEFLFGTKFGVVWHSTLIFNEYFELIDTFQWIYVTSISIVILIVKTQTDGWTVLSCRSADRIENLNLASFNYCFTAPNFERISTLSTYTSTFTNQLSWIFDLGHHTYQKKSFLTVKIQLPHLITRLLNYS